MVQLQVADFQAGTLSCSQLTVFMQKYVDTRLAVWAAGVLSGGGGGSDCGGWGW